jgi:hypothetical protein
MRAAFVQRPDYAPFTALPNQTSLTAGLATQPACGPDIPAPPSPGTAAAPAATVPADKQAVASKWALWKSQQRLTGPDARADSTNPAQMNHFDWYDAHNWSKPYPGEDTIYAPEDVPGAYIPAVDSD